MAGLDFEQKVVYGPSGKGDVRFNKRKDGTVSSVKVIAEDTTVYEIDPESVAPEVPQETKKGIYFSLNAEEDVLQAIRPWSGQFRARFAGFTKRGDEEEPEPYVKRGGKRTKKTPSGKTSTFYVPDQLRFTCILEITHGDFAGYTLLYWLPYIFERGEDGRTKVVSRSGPALDRVGKFLRMTGWNAEDESIPFSDNILPYLEAELLDRADEFPFMLTVERGWPAGMDKIGTGVSFS